MADDHGGKRTGARWLQQNALQVVTDRGLLREVGPGGAARRSWIADQHEPRNSIGAKGPAWRVVARHEGGQRQRQADSSSIQHGTMKCNTFAVCARSLAGWARERPGRTTTR